MKGTWLGARGTAQSKSMMNATIAVALLGGILAIPLAASGQSDRPMRILLTNDDGIDKVEERVYPMAQELRPFADVYIVVSNQDRSGTDHFMSINRKATLESQLLYVSEAGEGLNRLEIHMVDGYPADCVALGIRGIMREDPPDLAISGPNNGANLGDDWFGSGTIGAARTAAFLGVPAIAVSGLNQYSQLQLNAISSWVAQLAQSELVRSLPELVYLTVGFPLVAPSEVSGIRVARRARFVDALSFRLLGQVGDSAAGAGGTSVWAIRYGEAEPPPHESDMALYAQDYIVVTPMRADEHDSQLLDQWKTSLDRFPAWPPN